MSFPHGRLGFHKKMPGQKIKGKSDGSVVYLTLNGQSWEYDESYVKVFFAAL